MVFGEVVRRSVVSMDAAFARGRVCRDIPTANAKELAFFAGTLSRCVVAGMSATGRGFNAGVFDNGCGASALELSARELRAGLGDGGVDSGPPGLDGVSGGWPMESQKRTPQHSGLRRVLWYLTLACGGRAKWCDGFSHAPSPACGGKHRLESKCQPDANHCCAIQRRCGTLPELERVAELLDLETRPLGSMVE